MVRSTIPTHRRAATALEFALIAPLLFAFIFGLIVGGLGIFRYQQVAALAREAARYAAVHGTEYERETKLPAATQDSIYKDVVLARAVGLDSSRLQCAVTWDKNNAPNYVNTDKTVRTNVVTVTVSYQWVPELYFGGVTVSSTSKMPMAY